MTFRFQVACCLLVLLSSAAAVQAQVINSGAQTIALSATLTESLSVNLSSNSVSFTLTGGSATNAASGGVTATTTWIAHPGRNLAVLAYFASSTAAMTDGFGNNIPSADISISNNGGGYAPLTNTVALGGASAGLQLFAVKVTGTNKNGSNVSNMLFNLDLSTISQLPAGTYTGTLNIQAQVI
jgi:hypothetical protein